MASESWILGGQSVPGCAVRAALQARCQMALVS